MKPSFFNSNIESHAHESEPQPSVVSQNLEHEDLKNTFQNFLDQNKTSQQVLSATNSAKNYLLQQNYVQALNMYQAAYLSLVILEKNGELTVRDFAMLRQNIDKICEDINIKAEAQLNFAANIQIQIINDAMCLGDYYSKEDEPLNYLEALQQYKKAYDLCEQLETDICVTWQKKIADDIKRCNDALEKQQNKEMKSALTAMHKSAVAVAPNTKASHSTPVLSKNRVQTDGKDNKHSTRPLTAAVNTLLKSAPLIVANRSEHKPVAYDRINLLCQQNLKLYSQSAECCKYIASIYRSYHMYSSANDIYKELEHIYDQLEELGLNKAKVEFAKTELISKIIKCGSAENEGVENMEKRNSKIEQSLIDKNKLYLQIIENYHNIAQCYSVKNISQKVLDFYEKIVTTYGFICPKSDMNKRDLIKVCVAAAKILEKQDKYDEAVRQYRKALQYFKGIKSRIPADHKAKDEINTAITNCSKKLNSKANTKVQKPLKMR